MKNMYIKIIGSLCAFLLAQPLFGMEVVQKVYTGTIQIHTGYKEIPVGQSYINFFTAREFNFDPHLEINDKLVRVRIESDSEDLSEFKKQCMILDLECEKYEKNQPEIDMSMLHPFFPRKLLENKVENDEIVFRAYGHRFNLKYKNPLVVEEKSEENRSSDKGQDQKQPDATTNNNKPEENNGSGIKKFAALIAIGIISIPVFNYIIKPGYGFVYSMFKSKFRNELRQLRVYFFGRR